MNDHQLLEAFDMPGLNIEASLEPRELELFLIGCRSIRLATLEEAAKVCEEMVMRDMSDEDLQAQRCADAIRALSQKDPQ